MKQTIPKPRSLKLLVSAYACQPGRGSDQGFAWSWIEECAKTHDVTVLTCEAQREAIEQYCASRNVQVRFRYVKGSKRVSPSAVEYRFERIKAYLWQLRAIGPVRRLARAERFELAQHITVATWRLPSCLAFTNIPFIMGPVSGSENLPKGFAGRFGVRAFLAVQFRSALMKLAWCDPFVRFTLHRAKRILVCGPATQRALSKRYPGKVDHFTHASRISTDVNVLALERRRSSGEPHVVQAVWMGRLIARKGLELLLRALADPRLSECKVDVLGDGPERRRYEKLVQTLNLQGHVRFQGHVARVDALRLLASADIFVFTSLQDLMGQALSEAMQLGVPSVVMDWSGPAELVGPDGAARVPVASFGATCKELADTLAYLCSDPLARERLSEKARQRIMWVTDPKMLEQKRDRVFYEVSAR